MNKLSLSILLLLFSFNSHADPKLCKGSLSPKSYEDCFAFEAIVRAIAVPRSHNDLLEIPREYINVRNYPWELGLIVLDRSNSKEALISLAYLNSFQLDGALSEIHTCVSLKKGKELIPFLKEVITKSNNLCTTITKSFRIEENKFICRKQPVTFKRTARLIKQINKGDLCEQ
jgi:hypothetical protein